MRLKMMELDYERTLAADKIKDEIELKGKFEQLDFNNVKFENPKIKEENHKNEEIQEIQENQKIQEIQEIKKNQEIHENQQENLKIHENMRNKANGEIHENQKDDSDEGDDANNCIKHDDYQQLSDDSNKENDEDPEWGDMQTAEIKPNVDVKKDFIIDAEKIKNIMSKIQIKPPEWATSYLFKLNIYRS